MSIKTKTVAALTATPIAAAAMVAALSLAPVHDAKAAEMEKCYGITKAGKNDCQTANGSCAGTAKMDHQADAFIALPKGTCDKIAGGSLKPMMGGMKDGMKDGMK